jgi:hypothetical protein
MDNYTNSMQRQPSKQRFIDTQRLRVSANYASKKTVRFNEKVLIVDAEGEESQQRLIHAQRINLFKIGSPRL